MEWNYVKYLSSSGLSCPCKTFLKIKSVSEILFGIKALVAEATEGTRMLTVFSSLDVSFCITLRVTLQAISGNLLPKLFWPPVRKNCCSDWEKNLKFEAEGREFEKFLRSLCSSRTIYSKSERSEQFLVTECFFNLFLRVSPI